MSHTQDYSLEDITMEDPTTDNETKLPDEPSNFQSDSTIIVPIQAPGSSSQLDAGLFDEVDQIQLTAINQHLMTQRNAF